MDIKDRLKLFFFDRAPNSVLEDYVRLEFHQEPRSNIDTALSALESDGFLVSKVQPNERCPTLQRKSYRIAGQYLASYPIKTEIEAAGIKVPRLIDGDAQRAEDVNSLILAVNKIIDAKTAEMERRVEEQSKRFWSTLIAIFALFISLFSIINVGVRPALFADSLALSPVDLAFQSLLNILPLSLVLVVFLWILDRILNK